MADHKIREPRMLPPDEWKAFVQKDGRVAVSVEVNGPEPGYRYWRIVPTEQQATDET